MKTCGIDGIALTKLDILDGLDEIKVCVGYSLDGERLDRMPASQAIQQRLEPIYKIDSRLARRRRGHAPGPICRRRRSNMCAGSRN